VVNLIFSDVFSFKTYRFATHRIASYRIAQGCTLCLEYNATSWLKQHTLLPLVAAAKRRSIIEMGAAEGEAHRK
jgi:hypothetical protein